MLACLVLMNCSFAQKYILAVQSFMVISMIKCICTKLYFSCANLLDHKTFAQKYNLAVQMESFCKKKIFGCAIFLLNCIKSICIKILLGCANLIFYAVFAQ